MSKIHPAWDKKRKRGDRFDGKLIKELDSMHVIMPAIYPNRCDNEAFFRETFDITELRAFVDKKNESGNPVKCTVFQALVACTIKLLYLRPKMNRFIANRLMYQRNEVTAAFTVKKAFHDDGAEALAIVNATPNDTFDTIHRQVADRITSSRSDSLDKSSEAMDVVSRMPRRLTRSFVRFIGFLDRVGHCPKGSLLRIGRALEPRVPRPRRRLPPPDELGNDIRIRRRRNNAQGGSGERRRNQGDARIRGPGADDRRTTGRWLLLLENHKMPEANYRAAGIAG